MRAGGRWAFALASLCANATSLAWAQGRAVRIAGSVEPSGPGTTSGTNVDEGAKPAAGQIRAADGMRGRSIDDTRSDTQSQPRGPAAMSR